MSFKLKSTQPQRDASTSTKRDDQCSVFLSSYGVLGARAHVLATRSHTVTLQFERWEFPALEVDSKVTLSFVFTHASGSVLYTPATVKRRSIEADHVVLDIEVAHDDLAANSALMRLGKLLEGRTGSDDLKFAEH